MFRAMEAVGSLIGREFEENWARREEAEEIARSLGLTAVFADEASALIEFVSCLT